jgi:hypothetical protein
VPGHALINQLAGQATPEELGGNLSHLLADRLRITRGEATLRVAEAADLGPRQTLTGEPLVPRLPATAAAQRDGAAGAGHVAVIRRFFDELPSWIDAETRDCAEVDLANQKEAIRCLKQRLSDVIYRQLTHDAQQADPGGHSGAALIVSRGRLTPHIPTLQTKSLPGPA